jgi:hypothetical protein
MHRISLPQFSPENRRKILLPVEFEVVFPEEAVFYTMKRKGPLNCLSLQAEPVLWKRKNT